MPAHELLLRHAGQLVAREEPCPFDAAGGAEAPAAAALRLILNLSDRPLRAPVNAARERLLHLSCGEERRRTLLLRHAEGVVRFELLFAEVGELGRAERGVGVLLLQLRRLDHVGHEDVDTGDKALDGEENKAGRSNKKARTTRQFICSNS